MPFSQHTTGTDTTDGMVDWGLAVSTAGRLTRPGPEISAEQAQKAVTDLREFAALAEGHVRSYTGLHASGAAAPVLVVDRRGWVQANADSFREVLAPLGDKVRAKQSQENAAAGEADSAAKSESRTSSFAGGLGSRVTGLEAGAVLAFLSGKVLGQFDPFWSQGHDGSVADPPNGKHAAAPGNSAETQSAWLATTDSTDTTVLPAAPVGRLLLVAPNVVHVERELDVDPRDFRLWVCLHEETHRVQFTAVPWLRDYLRGQINAFLQETELDPSAVFNQLRGSIDQVGRLVRGERDGSLIDLVQTPTQREVLDQLTAVMSLLEGHADVVMDGVGPEVIPTVGTIRRRFQERRQGGSFGDQLIKRLLGLDAKMKQYRDGATFVRHVVERVDQEGLNRVWTSPQTLPTKAEINDPDAWLRRVHTL